MGHSFNDIYTDYYKKSFLYVKSYVHDEMVAEDITSECIIKLWETMKKEPVVQIRSFLFSILKNRALDYLKHQVIQKNVQTRITDILNRELEIRINSLTSSDPGEIFSSEVQEIIERTLQTLPEKTREVFILSRFEGLSHKEIAALYGISVKGVDYHIGQSVKELRIALKDYLPLLGMLSLLRF